MDCTNDFYKNQVTMDCTKDQLTTTNKNTYLIKCINEENIHRFHHYI